MTVQSLGMGAQAPLGSSRLPDDRRRRRRAVWPSSASAATRIPPSSSRPWSSRRPGRAPRIDDTLKQVTERIERKLQETPGLDFLRSYTTRRRDDDLRQPEGSTPAREVPDIWYQVRKNIGDIRHTLPAGVVGPGFNDEFGDTFGIIYGFTADGFTHRELRDYVEDDPLATSARARRLEDRDHRRAGRADLRRVLDPGARRPRHRPRGADRARCRRRTSSGPPASIQTGDEKLLAARLRRLRLRAGHPQRQLPVGRPHDPARATSPTVRRGYADPPQPMFRVNGKPAIGLAIAMRDGGDILALGAQHQDRRWPRSRPTCRSASSRASSPTRRSPSTTPSAIHDLAVAGDRHHHGGELHQPGRARRARSWRCRSR